MRTVQVSTMVSGTPALASTYAFPAPRPLNRATLDRLKKFLVILCTLFLFDVVTTQLILQRGGTELNPFMEVITSDPYLHLGIKAAIILLIYPVSLVAEQRVKRSGTFFYCILIVLYSFIVLHNMFVLLSLMPGNQG